MYSSKSHSLLFSLIKSALWNYKVEGVYSPQTFWDVLQMAEEQTLSGIVFDGLSNLSEAQRPNQDFILEVTGITFQIESLNTLLNKKIAEVAEIFNQAQIKGVMIKGQGIGELYPFPMHRQSGDVDIYIPNEQYKRAFEVALSLNPLDYDYTSEHANLKFEDWVLELHTTLVDSKMWRSARRMDKWFKEELSKALCTTHNMLVPDEMFNVVFIFQHFFHHFLTSGTGLRQLCDWALCLKEYRNKYGKSRDDELRKLLIRFKLLRPWQGFGNIVVENLGLHVEMMPLYVKWEHTKTSKMLNRIFEEGNFGMYSSQKHYSSNYWFRKWYSFTDQLSRQYQLLSLFPVNALMSMKNPFNSIEQIWWDYKKGNIVRNNR